ncbi:hypothetical protein L228DRAFT_272435 [Xylona heveae TC161]|uniref:Protection of telomeres protein 1 n=1 Tax=Xylona heveae (strain CBS 132557 / TC161) TaxID=1328760 RepID=A0A165JRL6_XYLHT|nr:hypothetical protein L228DRAFT_272435 [Xylona heveae TC161]KZF26547.1 hypothetical protein L228DRAFT_272435 [Xylona heveae TC161]
MDDIPPPKGYVSIEDVCKQLNKTVNVIGILVDYMPASATRGKGSIVDQNNQVYECIQLTSAKILDYQITFAITDMSQYYSNGSLRVKCFNSNLKELPAVQGTGDVVILQKFKITSYNGNITLLSSSWSHWTVFPASTIPVELNPKEPSIPHCRSQRVRVPPSPAECLYAVQLCNSQDRSQFTVPAEVPASLEKPDSNGRVITAFPAKDKFSLVKDVEVGSFYDLVGEVIRIFSGNSVIEMYVTDYTQNYNLYNYRWVHDKEDATSRDGDEYGYTSFRKPDKQWPGPYGKRTLRVSLWGNHAFYAQENVKVGQHVLLRNVRMKMDQCSQLEGTMFDDMKFPDRVDVSILKPNHDRVKEVKDRAEDYWEKNKTQKENYLQQIHGIKRKGGNPGPGESKRAKKNKKRAQKKRDVRNKDQESDKGSDPDDNEGKEGGKEEEREAEDEPFDQSKLNKHVKANHPAYPVIPVSEIVEKDLYERTSPKGTNFKVPFLNAKCRACVRIVDFYPPKLEDFAIRVNPKEAHQKEPSFSDDEQGFHCSPIPESRSRWQWRFCLLLEDGRSSSSSSNEEVDRLQLIVADMDAVFLLGMDATDLRNDENALCKLRETLFILWGDLEEQKQAAAAAAAAARLKAHTVISPPINSNVLQPLDLNSRHIGSHLTPRKQSTQAVPSTKAEKPKSKDIQPPPSKPAPPLSPPIQAQTLPKSSAKPFICCIKEYGVKVPVTMPLSIPRPPPGQAEDDEYPTFDLIDDMGCRWERRFQLWGTTIMT